MKAPEEVQRLRAATLLADEAFERVLAEGLIGRTEREVALALESHMRALGAQGPSFDTIVAAGPHGALPHAQPRDVAIEPGQLVVIDWGAELDGYCSDCTRTVATGEPDEAAGEVYALVLAAQLDGLAAVRPGAAGVDVDAVPRARITDGGHGDHFGHGLGHGVGIEIHEAPRLSMSSEDTLVAGNVVTVEPGIYLPGPLRRADRGSRRRHRGRVRHPHHRAEGTARQFLIRFSGGRARYAPRRMISTNQFKNGNHIDVDGTIFKIVEFQHVKPGKGGAFVRTKLRRASDGNLIDRTFRAGEKFRSVRTEVRRMQFLYKDGTDAHFMDAESYEQLAIPEATLAEPLRWMKDSDEVEVLYIDDEPADIQLPSALELAIAETEPGVRGDTASGGGTKPATLETGTRIQVPLFVDVGDVVRVDTRSGEYVSRA